MPHVLALRWFNEAANGGATYQRFLQSGAERIPGGGVLGEGYFDVEAALFRKSSAAVFIIQNCSVEERLLRLPKSLSEKAPSLVETLGTAELTSASANIAPTRQSVAAGGAVRIPAYSLTRIVWR
jgi:hypothetical protein